MSLNPRETEAKDPAFATSLEPLDDKFDEYATRCLNGVVEPIAKLVYTPKPGSHLVEESQPGPVEFVAGREE